MLKSTSLPDELLPALVARRGLTRWWRVRERFARVLDSPYNSEDAVVKYLANGTLVGLLPLPSPIMVRRCVRGKKGDKGIRAEWGAGVVGDFAKSGWDTPPVPRAESRPSRPLWPARGTRRIAPVLCAYSPTHAP